MLEDIIRFAICFGLQIGVFYFWYFVMSRTGSI